MTEIRARILVDPQHRISGTAPAAVPPGVHEVTIEVSAARAPGRRSRVPKLPTHDVGPWPQALSLPREDIYDERRALSFVETNVLVYSTAKSAPFRERARAALSTSERLSISRQILREYLAVMTRPQLWAAPLSVHEAVADATAFIARFAVLEDGPAVWDQLIDLSRRQAFSGRQIHDANIVATMLAHGERRLLTFNEADFRRFSPAIEVVTP